MNSRLRGHVVVEVGHLLEQHAVSVVRLPLSRNLHEAVVGSEVLGMHPPT